MGMSTTRKWQIGRIYKFGNFHYQAVREKNGYVYFDMAYRSPTMKNPNQAGGIIPNMRKKQQHILDKR
jgi:hypothetical protein